MTDKATVCVFGDCNKPAKWNVQGPGKHMEDVQQVCDEHLAEVLAFGTSQVWPVLKEATREPTDAEAMDRNEADFRTANAKPPQLKGSKPTTTG